MEPFTIQCTTCQSRIRVKNPKMVGQLANCPKCSSMIMIAPPQQITVQNPGNAAVDSMAMTKEGISGDFLQSDNQFGPQESHNQATEEQAAGEQHADIMQADDEYRLAPEPASVAAPAKEHFEDQSLQHAEDWQPDDQPLLPTDSWTSEKNARTQQILIVGFLSLAGIGLSIVGFMAFLNWYNAEPSKDLASNQPVNEEGLTNTENQPAESQAPNGQKEPDNGQNEPAVASAELVETTSDNPDDSNSSPALSSNSAEQQEAQDTTDANEGNVEESINDLFQQAGELDDPPTPLPDSLSTEAGGDLIEGNDLSIPDALKALKAMEDIVGYSPQVSLPEDSDVEPGAPPVTAAELGLQTVGGRPPVPPVDYTQRSQFTLDGLNINKNDVPAESINIWVHLSGIPTLIDFDVMAAANRSIRNARFGIRSNGSRTIQDLGQEFAASGGLVASPVQNRFVAFSLPEQEVTQVLPMSVGLDGLLESIAGDADQEQWLNENLGKLLPGSKGAWQVKDGNLAYDNTQIDALTWFRVLRLLENWKLLTGVQSSTQAYSSQVIHQPFLVTQQVPGLETKLTRITVQSEPVGQTLSRVAADAKINCWIDWPVVASAGLGPMTEDLSVTYNRTLKEVLTDYCDRYSLIAAILDEQSVWLTTQAAYRMQTRFYALPSEGKTPEQWEEALRPLTPVSASGIGRVVVVPSPDRKYILVRCCRPKLELSL